MFDIACKKAVEIFNDEHTKVIRKAQYYSQKKSGMTGIYLLVNLWQYMEPFCSA